MTLGKRILFVEDDDDLRLILMEQLEIQEEFLLTEARTGKEAIQLTREQYFDAILLNLDLPDTDGREVCRDMRRYGVKSPIIMISGVDTDLDTILGRNVGVERLGKRVVLFSVTPVFPESVLGPSVVVFRSKKTVVFGN